MESVARGSQKVKNHRSFSTSSFLQRYKKTSGVFRPRGREFSRGTTSICRSLTKTASRSIQQCPSSVTGGPGPVYCPEGVRRTAQEWFRRLAAQGTHSQGTPLCPPRRSSVSINAFPWATIARKSSPVKHRCTAPVRTDNRQKLPCQAPCTGPVKMDNRQKPPCVG